MEQNNISFTSALLVFYVIIASNFTPSLYSKQLQTYVKENRMAQHFIGFTMLLVIIMLFTKETGVDMAIFYAAIGYIWFIFTTKLEIHFNIIIILLLLFGFLYESNLTQRNRNVQNDPNIPQETQQEILTTNSRNKIWFIILILIITGIGTISYINKKDLQYGQTGGSNGYNIVSFLFY